MDAIMYNMMNCMDGLLFGQNHQDLAQRFDLPLLRNPNHYDRFGMFDIVQYYNQKSSNETNKTLIERYDANVMNVNHMNCVPHYDPGLLSLSILSTVEGLQLLDPTSNQW